MQFVLAQGARVDVVAHQHDAAGPPKREPFGSMCSAHVGLPACQHGDDSSHRTVGVQAAKSPTGGGPQEGRHRSTPFLQAHARVDHGPEGVDSKGVMRPRPVCHGCVVAHSLRGGKGASLDLQRLGPVLREHPQTDHGTQASARFRLPQDAGPMAAGEASFHLGPVGDCRPDGLGTDVRDPPRVHASRGRRCERGLRHHL
mmetsp:Transcript_47610/g.132761  ORF Transcript_47610/g.132761 Transcript_47610/m.132761 type:complete len:200 (-) Transcript_47610:2246-2845(-)